MDSKDREIAVLRETIREQDYKIDELRRREEFLAARLNRALRQAARAA